MSEYEQLVSLEFPAAPVKGLKAPKKSNSTVYTNCLDAKVEYMFASKPAYSVHTAAGYMCCALCEQLW